MNKSFLGSLAIIFGSLVLSLQLYGLKIIQGLEMQKGSWQSHAIDYASEPPISFALWTYSISSVCIIIRSWMS